jgi:hypothetical protein
MAETPLSDDDLREIARRLADGEQSGALAREYHVSRAAILKAGAEIGGARLSFLDRLDAEHRESWPEPSALELAAGAIIAARGLQSPGRDRTHTGRQIAFEGDHEPMATARKYRETGRLVVDGRLVTEADARAAQYRERWLEASDN